MTLGMLILLRRYTSFARFGASCVLTVSALFLDAWIWSF